MEKRTIERITKWVAGLALPLILVAFLGFGTDAGIGAIAGAALSVANWMALRWLVGKIMAAGDRARAVLVLLLVVKMAAVLVAASILLRWVDGIGFTIGMGALVLGVLIGALHGHLLGETSGDDDVTAGSSE
jgi:hypothetical protein